LFDAFAALPGMDSAVLIAALQARGTGVGRAIALDGDARLIWQRTARGVVVR
jgi:hypothetical protein